MKSCVKWLLTNWAYGRNGCRLPVTESGRASEKSETSYLTTVPIRYMFVFFNVVLPSVTIIVSVSY